jgi:hypothetical protein
MGPNEVNIVAIGSSSTKGDGPNSDSSQLKAVLANRFPSRKITVFNAGMGGPEALDEAARFKKDVLPSNPALVIQRQRPSKCWISSRRSLQMRGLHYSAVSKSCAISTWPAAYLFDQMISHFDGNWLHQNGWSYNRIAEALCEDITEALGNDRVGVTMAAAKVYGRAESSRFLRSAGAYSVRPTL